jgi:Family of unknown function (DUF6152)
MRPTRPGLVAMCLLALARVASAHHSYAMFDTSGTKRVAGTLAKLEWTNPHAFIWVYVPSSTKPGTYDLWGFENGSPSVLQGFGWNKDVLKAGDKIEVEYWPLRDGSIGGHCEKVKLPDERVLQCPNSIARPE